MENSEALRMLVKAYRDEIDWLMARAEKHEVKVAPEFVTAPEISGPRSMGIKG